MSFDSLNRYSPNHKTWDHVGNVVPVVEASEGQRPHGEFRPAAWLPVQFFEKYYEVYYVVLPGKVLSTDNQGRLCPAQYGLGSATITYGTNDVEAGVLDVRTGATLLSSATGTFNVSAVTDFMGTGETMAVSKPVGVAPYAYFQWSGDGSSFDDGFNPAGFRQHNHQLQHRTAFLCDYVLELPVVPGTTATENLTEDSYSASTERVTLDALANLPVAKNTVRTAFTFANGTLTDAAARFVREVPTVADVLGAGDYHVNYTTGVITVHATGALGAGNIYQLTYFHYAAVPSTVSKYACVVGDVTAGDFLKADSNSNWTLATAKTFGDGVTDDFDTFADIMGQVIEVEDVYNKSALGRVRTAYNPAINTDATGSLPGYSGQLDQMPGSATGGVPAKVHYAGAANLVARVNLISR